MQQPITRDEVKKLQQQNQAVRLVDIRTTEEYEKLHVPGAVNMPAATIADNITKFAANDTIVCICNKGQERSQNAAEKIAALGFAHVYYLQEGTAGWPEE